MPAYDDDLPTDEEEVLLRRLTDNTEREERFRALIQVI